MGDQRGEERLRTAEEPSASAFGNRGKSEFDFVLQQVGMV
jgi:hypothetical protein